MNGTINKLRSNPFYIPNDKQGEEMWKAQENDRLDKEEKEKEVKNIVYDVPPVHDNSVPVHQDIKKRGRKRK